MTVVQKDEDRLRSNPGNADENAVKADMVQIWYKIKYVMET